MAHNLNQKADGSYSFVAVGEKAWHGLGTYVNEAMTAEEAIRLGGLDYIVEKKKLQIAGGKNIPGFFATVRKDTGDPLGIVSDDYHVIQNSEAFIFFDSIIDRGEAIYQTAGALGKGERIFISAKLPNDILVNGEQIENYLILTQGHTGKKGAAIQVGFTPVRVVCQNTLNAALRGGLSNKVTILHFKNAKDRLADAAKVMGLASTYTTELNSIFNQMAETKISDKQLREYVEKIMIAKPEEIGKEEFSKQFVKQVDSIIDFAHNHPTQMTDAAKGTVWGAYNSISGYFNFLKNYKTQEEKFNDIYFKAAAGKVEKAFDFATALI
jgi:phage/plasmid-like protein (TIGR03299 family)